MSLAAWPISQRVALGARLGYATLSGTLERDEATRLIQSGVVINGTFQHRVDATIPAISIEPMMMWRAVGSFFVDAGVRASLMLDPRVEQTEQIVEPSNSGTFIDANGVDTRRRTRNEYEGALGGSVTNLALIVGLHYELPLKEDRSWILAPEITMGYGLTSIGGASWNVHPFRVGISVMWQSTHTDEPTIDPTLPPPLPTPLVVAPVLVPLIPAPKDLTVGLGLYADAGDGQLDTVERIVVDETISEQITAVLPMVFFAHGSSAIPERYRAAGRDSGFRERQLFGKGALDIYHRIIDIVGRRMTDNPGAHITLTGAIMPDSVEQSGSSLAKDRAVAVKQRLVEAWGIDEERVEIRHRDLPEQASSVRHDDGREENRRVDITADDPAILDLVRVEDTLRISSVPELVVRPNVISDTTVTEWTAVCRINGVDRDRQHGLGNVPTEIRFAMDPTATSGSVEVEITVKNAGGRIRSASQTIPIEYRSLASKAQRREGLKRVDEYGLILFAFGKASLEGPNARILDLIRARIEPASDVIVRGHADRTGSAEVNLRLTTERANAVGAALGHPRTNARGMGQRGMLYTNDVPEGRFYNRTVRVRVETPISP